MPNGGSGNCGGCLYNMRHLLEENFRESPDNKYFGANPGYCILRKVVIPDVGYTSCHNTQYDDFGDETRRRQLNTVLFSQERIKGNIWTANSSGDTGWYGSPEDDDEVWDYKEWKKWNKYVRSKYPKLLSEEWLKDISPWD